MKHVKSVFIIRKNKKRKDGLYPIYLRISVSGQVSEISLKKYIKLDDWDDIRQNVKGRSQMSKSLNTYLDQIKSEVVQAESELIKENRKVTSVNIKAKLKGEKNAEILLHDYFESHNKKLDKLVGNGYSLSTLKKYRTCLKHVDDFIENKNISGNLKLTDVDLGFIKDFEYYLKTKLNPCSHNSSLKYIDHLRKVILEALEENIIKENPFNFYNEKYEKKDPEFLNIEELKSIQDKIIENERVSRVRDTFLFCCYTGLSFTDVLNLRKEDIEFDSDGEKWISIKRQKTKEPSLILLLKIPLNIIDKYNDDPETEDGRLLPIISNQKTNAYLKEVAGICDIKKNITFHMARHTFATTVALENGVPIETVQKILGHKDARSTEHYARVTKAKIRKEMKILSSKI
ncbi:site-specific integrase [bacterium]|nr:site-specific integrase [bacterium]